MSDGPTPSNGGKWELMHYVHKVSSHLPPLGGVGASDMIGIAIEHIPGYQAGCWNILIFGTVPLWHVCPSQLFHVRFSTCTRHHLFHSLTGIFLCDHHKRPEGRKILIVVWFMVLEENKEIWKAARLRASKELEVTISFFIISTGFLQNQTKISIIS